MLSSVIDFYQREQKNCVVKVQQNVLRTMLIAAVDLARSSKQNVAKKEFQGQWTAYREQFESTLSKLNFSRTVTSRPANFDKVEKLEVLLRQNNPRFEALPRLSELLLLLDKQQDDLIYRTTLETFVGGGCCFPVSSRRSAWLTPGQVRK